MPDNIPDSAPQSLPDLRKLREEFVKAQADTLKKLEEVDKQISVIERAQAEERRKAAVGQIVPNGDEAALGNREITFLINNTKEGGHGPESQLGEAVIAAYRIYSLAKEAKAKDVSVGVTFWGGRFTDGMKLDTQFGSKAYNTNGASKNWDFLPAAKKVLQDNTPDALTDKAKNYVVIGDGSVSGGIDNAVAILEAAAKFNPKATFDFVVVNAKDTEMDKLVNKWSEMASGQKPNIVKVGTPKEISGVVLKIIKARVSGDVYAAPVAETTAAITAPKAPKP